MKPYCVYLITYQGDKLPPLYLGSTSRKRLAEGYLGSVSSKLYRDSWKSETRLHPELFSVAVLSDHDLRDEALHHELEMGEALDIVGDPRFVNRSLARPIGFFGMDVSGDKHPLYGVGHTQEAREKMSRSWTPERKAAFATKMTGRPGSPNGGKYERTIETRRLISERRTGMILSDSHCMNISNGLREMHQEDPSIRQRMSETRRGKKRKESSVAATAAAHRGMKRSEETKAKIKAAWVKRKERENEQA